MTLRELKDILNKLPDKADELQVMVPTGCDWHVVEAVSMCRVFEFVNKGYWRPANHPSRDGVDAVLINPYADDATLLKEGK
jgi:hypothetical protein